MKSGETEILLKNLINNIGGSMSITQNIDLLNEKKNINPIKISHLAVEREFYWDPYIEVKQDIKDSAGKILYKAGSKIKLYNGIKIADLVFLDGTQRLHVRWALLIKESRPCSTLMLSRGSGKKLTEQHNTKFYEDKHHYFQDKFEIKKVPAVVMQQGDKINIREININ